MDPFLSTLRGVLDRDLFLWESYGVACQSDFSVGRVAYDSAYADKCRRYEDDPVARQVVEHRVSLLREYLPAGARVLDVGIGSGAFMRAAQEAGYDVWGFDVVPETRRQLEESGRFSDDYDLFDAVTAWDSLEHMEEPHRLLQSIREGGMLFVSIPVFTDLRRIRESKHYRPGEHLFYWTAGGMVRWAEEYGMRWLRSSDAEQKAGRDSILEFAFVKERHLFHIPAFLRRSE